MRLVILGAPGAGKGTQATLLAEFYHCPHVSTGEIFRRAIAEGTELGRRPIVTLARDGWSLMILQLSWSSSESKNQIANTGLS